MAIESSPLYGALAMAIAEDEEIRAVARNTTVGQLPPNLLFAAVHYLLLSRPEHSLSRFYPTIGGEEPPQEAYREFRAFILEHGNEIQPILQQRAVQTNEVARSSVLLAAYDFVAKESESPLAIIEVGTSAGLNLAFDRYRHTYNPGPTLGPAASAVKLECLVRGADFPDVRMPNVAWRRGLDLNPLDVGNVDDARWLQSLIWPDQVDRFRRLQSAIAEFNTDPPSLIDGDEDRLLEVIAEVPSDSALCISHSFVLGQMDRATRIRLAEVLLAADRPVYRVSFELDPDREGSWLDMTAYEGGGQATIRLAEAHFHGAWIHWLHTGGPS